MNCDVVFLLFPLDIRCEMDTLICQKIRKLTSFYHRLKIESDKIDRIEFIRELCNVLVAEKPSDILEEVRLLISIE